MSHLHYCCNCHRYTLEHSCPHCNQETIIKKPPRFSPQDHYGKYRRNLKKINKKG